MVKKRVLDPIPVFDEDKLESAFDASQIKKVHTMKIWRHLAENPTQSFEQVPDLPLKAYALLQKKFVVFSTTITDKRVSSDGTVKLIVRLQDGHEVESVIMKHKGRNTLCVSSQVGCQMGCTFCATGTMGIIADLTCGEILEQLLHAVQVAPIRNVVFMGMGGT
jgi:adenine C2-methylase RlmN of 23S rRNA A2503 and tRNA A37